MWRLTGFRQGFFEFLPMVTSIISRSIVCDHFRMLQQKYENTFKIASKQENKVKWQVALRHNRVRWFLKTEYVENTQRMIFNIYLFLKFYMYTFLIDRHIYFYDVLHFRLFLFLALLTGRFTAWLAQTNAPTFTFGLLPFLLFPACVRRFPIASFAVMHFTSRAALFAFGTDLFATGSFRLALIIVMIGIVQFRGRWLWDFLQSKEPLVFFEDTESNPSFQRGQNIRFDVVRLDAVLSRNESDYVLCGRSVSSLEVMDCQNNQLRRPDSEDFRFHICITLEIWNSKYGNGFII